MKRRSLLPLPLLAAAALTACGAHRPLKLAAPFPALTTVAVLPMNNYTVSFSGPDLVRKDLWKGVAFKGYQPLPLEKVDAVLKDSFSVTDGGQLGSVDPQELGKALAVDALLYSELTEFGIQNVGFYINRRVGAHSTLLRPSDRSVLWEDQATFSRKLIETDPEKAKKAFFAGLAHQEVEKILKVELKQESSNAVLLLLQTLPAPH